MCIKTLEFRDMIRTLETNEQALLSDECTLETNEQALLSDECTLETNEQASLSDECTLETNESTPFFNASKKCENTQ